MYLGKAPATTRTPLHSESAHVHSETGGPLKVGVGAPPTKMAGSGGAGAPPKNTFDFLFGNKSDRSLVKMKDFLLRC